MKWIGAFVAAIVIVGGLVGLLGQFDRANHNTPSGQGPAASTTGQRPAQ
ncbi:MAG: hypothetical protein ACR2K5_01430 [Pseudolabrys sp.]